MAIVEAINIPIGVTGQQSVDSAANSYEDLGDAVAKTQLEAEKLAQQFGINDKRTQEAIKVAGQYKQQMEELDFAIDGARGGVDQLFRASQGIVAGFEVAAGAAALFGSESEELEKVLMKVQGAMVLSQGIKDLKEFAPAISNLAGIVRGRVVAAFSTLRTAIISTGIGALAVAVGLLIANWDSLVKKFNLSLPTLGEIGNKIGDIVQKITDYVGITSEVERTNEQVNKSIAKNISETQKQIAIAKAKGEQDKALALEENQRAAELVLAKRKLRQEDSEENRKAVEDAKHNLELTRIAQDNYRKDQLAKQREAAKQRQEQIKQQQDEEFELFVEQELANYEYRQKLAEDERQRADEEFNAWLDQELANYDYRKQLADKEVEEEKARKQAVADLEQKLFDESQALANAVIALAGEQSRIGKAVALASIGADTAMALSKALSNSQSPTPENVATGGLAGIAKYIGLATTILSNSKRAYDIIKAPAPSVTASGGGGANASAAVPRFNAPQMRLQGTNEFSQVNRVYVTERDITNVQQKVKVTESLSQF